MSLPASNVGILCATILSILKNCKSLKKLCAFIVNNHVLRSFDIFYWQNFYFQKCLFFRNFDPRTTVGLMETGLLFPGKMFVFCWNLPYLEANAVY